MEKKKTKKTLDEFTKCKLVYSGEYLLVGIIALTFGVLAVSGVLKQKDWKKWFFTIATLLGGLWAIADFIWTLVSKKKRAKNSLLDKILMLPNALVLIPFDIYALVQLIKDPSWKGKNGNYFAIVIGSALMYAGIVLIFESIYHYFIKVHPMVYEMMDEEKDKTKDQENEEKIVSKEEEELEKSKLDEQSSIDHKDNN